MRQVTKKKRIVIKTTGPLKIKGGIMGPITQPYLEDVSVICAMILRGYRVYEILSNGTELALDIQNYNVENNQGDTMYHYTPVNSAQDLKDPILVNTRGAKSKKLGFVSGPTSIDVYENR